MATWVAIGGNKPESPPRGPDGYPLDDFGIEPRSSSSCSSCSSGDARTPDRAFDNDLNTIWHGDGSISNQRVTITFKQPMVFQYLDWTTRPDKIFLQERYRIWLESGINNFFKKILVDFVEGS